MNNQIERKIQYGFMYRGNGYGFWDTVKEAKEKAIEKSTLDKSSFAWGFREIRPTLWYCINGKPYKSLGII